MLKKNRFDQLAQQLKAFSDPNRIRIIELLMKGEKTATELNKEIRVCQPTLSHHMKVLCSTGLVTCRKEGVRRYYRMHTDNMRALGHHLSALADYNDRVMQGETLPDPPGLILDLYNNTKD